MLPGRQANSEKHYFGVCTSLIPALILLKLFDFSNLSVNWLILIEGVVCNNKFMTELICKYYSVPTCNMWLKLCSATSINKKNIENKKYYSLTTNIYHMQASGHQRFVALIDKLITKVGIHRVFAGSAMHSPFAIETSQEVTSCAWLAAEILCTWRWPGGSAMVSFLPILSAYAKRSNSPQESLLDETLSILLDGALVHGGNGSEISIGMWPVPKDKMEGIEEPFLRALVSLLSTLFKENIWGTGKAMNLLELLLNKLYIGEEVNTNCLKILPLLISILLEPLCGHVDPGRDACPSSVEENFLLDTTKDWLERALGLPPLVTWQTGQGIFLILQITCHSSDGPDQNIV